VPTPATATAAAPYEVTNIDWIRNNNQTKHYLNAYLLLQINHNHQIKCDLDLGKGSSTNTDQQIVQNRHNTNDSIHSNTKQNYKLAAAKVSANAILNKITLTYGTEFAHTINKQNFNVLNPDNENNLQQNNNHAIQSQFAAFLIAKHKFHKITASTGVRFEYTSFDYSVNNTKIAEQSKSYQHIFPNVNLHYQHNKLTIAINYKNSIFRPNYT
jgi:hypothetical protein